MEEKKITLSWRPAGDEPAAKTAALAFAVLFFAFVASLYMDSIYWGVVAALLLLTALRSYFQRTTVTLGEEGLSISRGFMSRRRPWTDFRRVEKDRLGVFLATFDTPSSLDTFRGEYLRCPGRREEVIRFVSERIGKRQAGEDG